MFDNNGQIPKVWFKKHMNIMKI